MDIITAYKEIKTIKTIFYDMRENQSMEDMAVQNGMTIPRTCGRQTARSNVQASSPEEYWQRTIFVPFLDHLIQAFNDRFTQLNEDAIRGFQLLPSNLEKMTTEDAERICKRFICDLPSPDSFMQELRRWKVYWSGHTEPPSTLQDTPACPLYSSKSYPNISTILHILSVTPDNHCHRCRPKQRQCRITIECD